MLRFEKSLPKLPVPTLESTASKYLESVKPHLTPAEFATTQTVVKEFLSSPIGKTLQERLLARAAEPGRQSWISEWWNDAAYMGYRDPVVVFVSYFFLHLDDKKKPGQAQRAASLLKALLPFRALVERYVRNNSKIQSIEQLNVFSHYSKRLEPEKVRGMPLAMDSFQWL